MKKSLLITLILLAVGVAAVFYFYLTHDDHAGHDHSHETSGHDHSDHQHGKAHSHDHEEDGHDHDEDGHAPEPIEMSDATATAVGLGTVTVVPRNLQRQLPVFGRVMPDPETTWHISARFPGVVRSIPVHLGSNVKAGDLLASVEANDSLRTYNITAPGEGMILDRRVNPGEVVGSEPLFVLSDNRRLLVNLSIYPFDKPAVQAGLNVRLENPLGTVISEIRTFTPSLGTSPMSFAQVPVSNEQNEWVVGDTVRAAILLAAREVDVCVDNRALQTLEDGEAVFVKNGNLYEPRFVTKGETDGECTEILSGLNPGDIYVSANAYLLKADLEKSGAAHEH